MPRAAPSKSVGVTSGAEAVQQSKRAREQQDAVVDAKDKLSNAVKIVGGKTFYLQAGVWADREFSADARLPETNLTFGSDEYFALLKQKPALSQFFSLGEKVVVVFEGHVYRVNAAKP